MNVVTDSLAIDATVSYYGYNSEEHPDLLQIIVSVTQEDETNNDRVEIGRAEIYVVTHQSSINDYRYYADIVSGEFVESFLFLTTLDGDIGNPLREVFGNVAYLERFVIDPDFRNSGVGTWAIEEIVGLLSKLGVYFITLKPFPFEQKEQGDISDDLVNRLISFYSRFGFEIVDSSDKNRYMILQVAEI